MVLVMEKKTAVKTEWGLAAKLAGELDLVTAEEYALLSEIWWVHLSAWQSVLVLGSALDLAMGVVLELMLALKLGSESGTVLGYVWRR